MKTACFFTYTGPGRISIARRAPKMATDLPGLAVYSVLAPGPWFNRVSEEEYRRRYFGEILGPLSPREVWDDLYALVAPHEPVLLCWERLTKPDEWCHRQMVSEWFAANLGLDVPEFNARAK